MFNLPKIISRVLLSVITGMGLLSCKKMVTVPQPINSITTSEVFQTDAQATSAMAGIYTRMINGNAISFSNGYCTLLGGMSADELYYYGTSDAHILSFSRNQLLFNNTYTSVLWTSAYKTIYGANAVIEGIEASESSSLTDSVRKELTGQAKFVRALTYFYLTNFFGDVPLVMTVDFNDTRFMSRTSADKVYAQIMKDLKEAQSLLPADYSAAGAAKERVIPNRYAATALLARVYLYKGDYANAAAEATKVIDAVSLYSLENDPANTFLKNSKEAIWQLKQGIAEEPLFKNITREAYEVLPSPLNTGMSKYCVTSALLNAFEANDRRRRTWIDSTNNTPPGNGTIPQGYTWYACKYKLGRHNQASGVPSSEYYMVLRLAEMYLVRAEATAHNAGGGIAAAIADLNTIRNRAGLPVLPGSLTAPEVIEAVAHERQVELFAEWGHRWLDLKRTGRAHDVLSVIPDKQPWAGDYQLLYPIPFTEIDINPNLSQNPEY
jgi:starch-binding outer membrane protein, SusD/RagB family